MFEKQIMQEARKTEKKTKEAGTTGTGTRINQSHVLDGGYIDMIVLTEAGVLIKS